MRRRKAKTLHRRIAGSVFAAMMALWLALMCVMTLLAAGQLASETEAALESAMVTMRKNCALRMEDESIPLEDRARAMASELADPCYVITGRYGGIELRAYDRNGWELCRSGWAIGTGVITGGEREEYCYLQMDPVLDRDGQINYARWLAEHEEERALAMAPFNDSEGLLEEGRVAVATGVREGNGLTVYRLELCYGDGSRETIMAAPEAEFKGKTLTTLTFGRLILGGVLAFNDRGPAYALERQEEAAAVLDELEAEDMARGTGHSRLVKGTWSGKGAVYDWQEEGYGIAVGWSYPLLAVTMQRYLFLYAATLLAALVLAWFISALLAERLSAPLVRLAQDVTQGIPCAADGPIREVNALAKNFNEAQEKLEQDLKREQDLTRAVAHELKSPLAVLRSHAEALLEDIAPEKRTQYLNVIVDESDRMDALVRELLDLARLEAGAESLRRETVPLDEVVRAVFARREDEAAEKGVAVVMTLAPAAVEGDRRWLERAVGNYASNALRHCAPGGAVRILLEQADGLVRLTVENDGEPVAEEELPRLFETFYRGDAARSRDGGGTGLGLAIVRSVAALHGGSCGAENIDGGVRFLLTLPAAK